jgi:hypothetical protein
MSTEITDAPVVVPGWLLYAVLGTSFTTLLFPPSILRNALSFLALVLCFSQVRHWNNGPIATKTSFTDYGALSGMTVNAMSCLIRTYIRSTEHDLYKIEGVPKDEAKPLAGRNITWLQRASWAFHIVMTHRGIGWNWEVSNIRRDVPKNTPRK